MAVVELVAIRRRRSCNPNGYMKKAKGPRRAFGLRKRRAQLEGFRRPKSIMVKRIKTLRKIIPYRNGSLGLDGLFQDTADYIFSLQMRVRLMHILLTNLSNNQVG